MQAIKISLYLLVFVLANFVVLLFGQNGLLITALLLIPFDFVIRCLFHEQWKGKELILKLGALVIVSSLLTYVVNSDSKNIALGSAFGFIAAQIIAGIFYQLTINKKPFIKVNGSDALGIFVDSIIFQLVAFGSIDYYITVTQISLKLIGGLFWYWIIFVKYKLI